MKCFYSPSDKQSHPNPSQTARNLGFGAKPQIVWASVSFHDSVWNTHLHTLSTLCSFLDLSADVLVKFCNIHDSVASPDAFNFLPCFDPSLFTYLTVRVSKCMYGAVKPVSLRYMRLAQRPPNFTHFICYLRSVA